MCPFTVCHCNVLFYHKRLWYLYCWLLQDIKRFPAIFIQNFQVWNISLRSEIPRWQLASRNIGISCNWGIDRKQVFSKYGARSRYRPTTDFYKIPLPLKTTELPTLLVIDLQDNSFTIINIRTTANCAVIWRCNNNKFQPRFAHVHIDMQSRNEKRQGCYTVQEKPLRPTDY